MGWIGPKGEDIPPHPRQEPRFEGDLTADHIRFIFRDCADFGEREVLIGGDPEKRTTVFFINGQVRNERMTTFSAPWPPASCCGRPPRRRPSA